MINISMLDVSAVTGLMAIGVLTGNFLLGMLLSTSYKTTRWWKATPGWVRGISLAEVHNWTAYLALLLVLLHPVFLVFDKTAGVHLRDILLPAAAPKQPWEVAMGIISLYLLTVVIITTQRPLRRKLGAGNWKKIHLLSYGTALLVVMHGILMDPELKDRGVDWLDGEKLFPEGCGLLMLAATIARIRYQFQKN